MLLYRKRRIKAADRIKVANQRFWISGWAKCNHKHPKKWKKAWCQEDSRLCDLTTTHRQKWLYESTWTQLEGSSRLVDHKILDQPQGNSKKSSFNLPHHLNSMPAGLRLKDLYTPSLWLFPQGKQRMKLMSSFCRIGGHCLGVCFCLAASRTVRKSVWLGGLWVA